VRKWRHKLEERDIKDFVIDNINEASVLKCVMIGVGGLNKCWSRIVWCHLWITPYFFLYFILWRCKPAWYLFSIKLSQNWIYPGSLIILVATFLTREALSKFIELQLKNVLLICFNSILIIRSLAGNAFPTSSTPGSGAGQTSTRTSFVVPRAAILRSTSRPIPFASILTTMSEMSVSESIFRLSHFTKVIQLAFKLYWRPGLLKYLGL